MPELIYMDMGLCSFESAMEMQGLLLKDVIASDRRDRLAYLLLVEHDRPVITLGRNADGRHVLASPTELAAAGVEVRKCARGGDVTCHCPGQLVGYPILRLGTARRTVRRYVQDLEEVVIELLERFALKGRRRDGVTGVWVGDDKVAAIGIAVTRWVAWHGFALNVSADLSHFDLIDPCGVPGASVTSIQRLVNEPVSVSQVKPMLVECLAEVLGFDKVRLKRSR